MAKIPCRTCKHKQVEDHGVRVFYSCSNKEKKKGFVFDDFNCSYSCSNYEEQQDVVTSKQ